jgi:hypothetical protein
LAEKKMQTPKKDVVKAKHAALNLEREMSQHQTALHMMSPGHSKVNKIVGYGCQ